MKVSNSTWTTILTGVVAGDYAYRFFKMKNGVEHKSISSIEAANYRVGTRVTITLEEPEPPKERIVLPEGMKWIKNLLYTDGGALIAGIRDGENGGWHETPFSPCRPVEVRITVADQEEKRKVVENALAEHGYFGVRKVVDGN